MLYTVNLHSRKVQAQAVVSIDHITAHFQLSPVETYITNQFMGELYTFFFTNEKNVILEKLNFQFPELCIKLCLLN